MTRRITLPLGSTTNETHCMDCPTKIIDSCMAYGRKLHRDPFMGARRHHDCRAAGTKNEDGAIIRLLALLVRAPTDDGGRPEIECSRETLVDMAMAARRELDALRAKIEEVEAGDAE